MHTKKVTGNESTSHAVSVCLSWPVSGVSQIVWNFAHDRVHTLHKSPVNLSGSPSSQGDTSPLCMTPGLGHPIHDLFTFRVGLCPGIFSLFSESWLVSPSFLITYGSFLQPWMYKGLSARFNENLSTRGCIFCCAHGQGWVLHSPTPPYCSIPQKVIF